MLDEKKILRINADSWEQIVLVFHRKTDYCWSLLSRILVHKYSIVL